MWHTLNHSKLFRKTGMDSIRIIKKYPNRRLYDTTTSQYITLEHIKEFVLNHISFKVISTQTNEDVTNPILLQIITELESQRIPFFTTRILKNIILFYDNPLQKNLSEFLDQLFAEQQKNQKINTEELFKGSVDTWTELTKQNVTTWQNILQQYFSKTKP